MGLGLSLSKESERIINRVVKNLQIIDSLSNIINRAITLLGLLYYGIEAAAKER
jgi:hypothetical protein